MYFMNTKGVEYSAAVTRKKAGRPAPDDFRRSRLNPRSQSRTQANKRSGHAPSARVLDYARRSARSLAQQALAPPAAWRLLEDADGGALLYERVPGCSVRGGADSDPYVVRAVATVDAAADDVLRVLDAPTTEALAAAGPALFGTHFHAGVALNKLTCASPTAAGDRYSPDDAYAVLWLSLRCVSKLGAVENHRDTTAVSYQDAFDRDSLRRLGRSAAAGAGRGDPQLVAVHALVSTTLADVPPLPKSEATDRVHLRDSGVVVEPLSPGLCRVSLVLSLLPDADAKGDKKSDRKTRRWLQGLAVGGVASLARAVAARFPPPDKENARGDNGLGLALQPVDAAQWRDSDHCYICLKAFRAFRRCHHCRFCGEAVCGACSGHVDAHNGRAVDSGDWTTATHSSVDSGSSSGSSSRERASSNDKTPAALRACNACAYELEQRLSGAPSLPDPARDSGSSGSDSVSLSLYSVDRDPAGDGFSLSLPDFDDVLDEPADSSSSNAVVASRRPPPPPPPPPSYQFAMALQRGKLNAALPHPELARKQWTSADSLGAAMRGLEQYNASLSTASSSLKSRSLASLGSGATASLSDASLASLSLADGPAAAASVVSSSTSTSATPSRFLDVTEHDPRRGEGVRYHFSSFSESADGGGGSGSRSSAASSSFTDVSGSLEPPRNDMIPLAPPAVATRQFVVFPASDADSSSASVSSSTSGGTTGSNGSNGDMIPLTLL